LDDFISTENDEWGNRENPVFDWMNLIRAKKNKGHTIVMHVFYEILLRSSLRPDSGVYTLRVMKSVCAVKFSKSLNITLPFLWNLIDSKRLNSTIISNELN